MALLAFLIEDSSTIRDNLIPALADLAGIEVIGWADSEFEASAWLATHADEWDVLVVDMFLREGSGLGVLALCGTRQPYQRVAVLTNYPTADIRLRCKALGADAVFDKSTELEAFFEFCIGIRA